MRKVWITVLFLPLLLDMQVACASEVSALSIWAAAQEAYEAQDYTQAIALYDSLGSEGWHDARLYYNLATAHFQLGHIGLAILNYDRAHRLSPDLPNLAHNLSLAENVRTDNIVLSPRPPLMLRWQALFLALPLRAWTLLMLAGWVVLGGLGVGAVLRRLPATRLLWGAMTALLMTVALTGALAYSRYQYIWHSGAGVIVSPVVALRVGASAESAVRYDLHEGTRIRRIDRIGDWYKVRLENGEVGWLAIDEVALLFA